MLKFIKNIFYPEPANNKAVVVSIDYAELARKEREQDKAKWEADNELKKKRDACYLNTTKTAFYGTYAEFLENRNHNNLNYLGGISKMASQDYLARMQYHQMNSMGNMVYARNYYAGGSDGSIF